MAKLVCLFLILLSVEGYAGSLRLEFFSETSLPKISKLKDSTVGGLSGMAWNGEHLISISDDRGKFGGARAYELDLKIKGDNVQLTPLKAIPITGTGKNSLDMEAIVILPDGNLVLSSEGDNNAKPRSLPKIFITGADGSFKSDLAIPDKFLPEMLGEQKKGIENNRGFESLTATSDGVNLYAMSEAPILTDQPQGEDTAMWLRLVHFAKDKEVYKVIEELPYLISTPTQTDLGPELFRGVSEMLYWKESKFLVLERGARLGSKGIRYTGAIYMVDFQGTKDVSKVANIPGTKVSSPRKDKLVDLEELLVNGKPGKEKLENFENLSWGPNLSDGRKTLLVMSDNNFSAREKTQLLVFTVKEVE